MPITVHLNLCNVCREETKKIFTIAVPIVGGILLAILLFFNLCTVHLSLCNVYREETKKIFTIAVPIVGGIIILAILLSLFAYYCSSQPMYMCFAY